MPSHIVVHRATTNASAKSVSFRSKSEKEGLPKGSTPGLGAGGPEFKSRRPDQATSIQRPTGVKFLHRPILVQVGNNKENLVKENFVPEKSLQTSRKQL
jgi:hypothetical protein